MIIKKKCIMDELNVSVFANFSCKIEKKWVLMPKQTENFRQTDANALKKNGLIWVMCLNG